MKILNYHNELNLRVLSHNNLTNDDSLYDRFVGADWDLSTCCDEDQTLFIILACCFSVAVGCLWSTFIIFPFKLAAVLLHEMGHAQAAVLSCGKYINDFKNNFN